MLIIRIYSIRWVSKMKNIRLWLKFTRVKIILKKIYLKLNKNLKAGLITHESLRLYPEPISIKKKLYFESDQVIDGTLRFKSQTPLKIKEFW